MNFIRYFTAHFFLAVVVFLIGYWFAKKYPNLFGTLPILGSG